MLNGITHIIDYINVLIKEYPLVFHAFVSLGTIIAAVLGMKNAAHIKTQANIQREIESNRFNIQLFEHRINAYNNFKFEIKARSIFKLKNISIGDIDKIESFIFYDSDIIKKALFSFNSDDNEPLLSLLKENNILSHATDDIKRWIFTIKETQNLIKLHIDDYDILSERIVLVNDEINKSLKLFHSPIYDVLYHESINYMESKLEMPKEAFKPPLNMFQRLHGKLSKSEIMVMYAILGICALGLWCALLFGVAFKN
ncbi:hypothetical protein IGS75_14405 (plasmid) [Gluconobacter sphaericus]|uniref:hypothetical protein n=1 Tax=Gluconobacter sphaericus TaxID=574987 RepID=UPI001924505B|nr:hypothetical protein [Gluconobacter sphaericus]QQX92710.1 hypothetical protein IGS75_14405 [Gluconobacter sphaericus]